MKIGSSQCTFTFKRPIHSYCTEDQLTDNYGNTDQELLNLLSYADYSCNLSVPSTDLKYQYTDHLLKLELHRDNELPPLLSAALTQIVTPLVPNEWEKALTTHPDQLQIFKQYLLTGIKEGFRIGVSRHYTLALAPRKTCTPHCFILNQLTTILHNPKCEKVIQLGHYQIKQAYKSAGSGSSLCPANQANGDLISTFLAHIPTV